MTKKVLFSLAPEFVANASNGVLLGEFNNWDIQEGIHLQKQEDGSMRAELSLTAGKTYEYRYLLSDGRWVNDNNEKTFSPVFGHAVENCIISVPETIKRKLALKPKAEKKIKEKVPADDLTRIEGIGKKVAALLNAENIHTFKQLARCPVKKIQLILDGAGSKFSLDNPVAWPKQAKLAAVGNWEALAILQEELKKI